MGPQGPVWTGGKSRPHRDSIPDRPARSSVAIPTELPGPHNKYVLYCLINRTVYYKKRLLRRHDVLLAMYVANGLSPTHFRHLVNLTPSVYVLSDCTTRLERIKENFRSVFHGKVDLPECSQF